MFNRNPYMPETSDILREVDGDDTSMFAKILGAIKEADKIMDNKTTSAGQVILLIENSIKIHEVIKKNVSIHTHTMHTRTYSVHMIY